MIEETEARSRILNAIEPGPVIWVPLFLGAEHVLGQDLAGLVDSPGFDNSSMDGYAVKAEECQTGMSLQVATEEQPAGVDRQLELEDGQAIRIFTGASIPMGADAVIMQEDVERDGDTIRITEGVEKGENIRRRGGDVCTGQRLLEKGEWISPVKMGLLASQGFPELPVHCKPMVNIVTTGDELVEPGYPLIAGELYNSNGPMLRAAVENAGAVGSAIHAMDDVGELTAVLSEAIETGDIVVVAGGVSVGERDYVKQVLEDLGVETNFWRVKVKPGKPFLFGQHPDGCSIFGLPGNPVSAFVTFQLFVLPAIRKRQGLLESEILSPRNAVAGEIMNNRGDRPHYLRGQLDESGRVELSGTQQSHAIFGLSKANCLVRLEPEQEIAPGEAVQVFRI